MPYTVKEVSKLSGVSVRTLHYYDEIGLLQPAFYGENGYRFYDEEQLLRLQQILFFRELNFTLAQIQEVIDSDEFNQLAALQEHRNLLLQKTERFQQLLRTIDKTIDHLKGETKMSKEEMYWGFDQQKQKEYEQELIERYGKQAEAGIQQSRENTKSWKKEDYQAVQVKFDELNREMTALLQNHFLANSKEVQSVIQKHYEVINRFYVPTQEVYSGLGQLYVDHPDFRQQYDAFHPELAVFYREAMKHYAEVNLK
ncbi:MerR family transcriptional regulator [Brevibacillus ginsengisoli]|uniref:MerR family transcriptional regulator n=1 Tax=Brevibacillus ginsengisoli TaxID=363854 RepID=UPI003CEC5B79